MRSPSEVNNSTRIVRSVSKSDLSNLNKQIEDHVNKKEKNGYFSSMLAGAYFIGKD